jgi:hypothetical protein
MDTTMCRSGWITGLTSVFIVTLVDVVPALIVRTGLTVW